MARGVNKAILIGHLGADPEIRYTAGGSAVANIRLATTGRTKNEAGEWEDFTEWHRVVAFGTLAENAGQYLAKGSQAYIEGRIQTRKWQDNNGVDRWTTEIVAWDIQFLGGGKRDQDSAPSGGGQSTPTGGSGRENPPGLDDDIPF